jgi:hypothetical protein
MRVRFPAVFGDQMRRLYLFLFFAAILSSSVSIFGQQNISAASLSGTVSDTNSAAVAGASVVITETATNRSRSAVTDGAGRYLFNYVPVGDYTIRIEKEGFETLERGFGAAVGQSLTINVSLTAAVISADVDVAAEPPVIEQTRTQIGETVMPKEVDSLPLNGRNFLDLALLLPGISKTNTGSVQKFAETSAVPGTGISVAGQRNLNNSFIVDGSSANDDSVELAGTYYSQEVIREFQVVTNGALADYGRASSGFVSIITWSGTNQFRGKLYGFLRNDRFDARNPLAATRDPLTQTQYGGTFGGPIKHDRTFFFGNFEQTRRRDSNIITIAPANAAAINARLDSIGFGGPRIETGLVSGGYTTTNIFGRVDHKLFQNSDLVVTYNFYDINADNARTVGGLNAVSRGTNLANTDHTINAQLVSAVGSSMFNELRVQFRRSQLGAPPIDETGPAVNISGVANIGTATSSPTRRDIDLFQASDAVTYVTGQHSLKIGGEFIYNDLSIDFPGAMQGVYSFNNLNAFLAGNYSQYQQAFGAPTLKQSNPNLGFFAKDEWRFNSRLTLNLGVRYDLQFLPDPIRTDTDNFSPRVGFAYSPDDRTVVRGSFGFYYDRIPTRATSNALQRDGVNYYVAIFSPTTAGAPVFPNILTAAPSSLAIKPSITRIDPYIENGESTQASLQVERELPWKISASVGYMYLRGRHIILSRNVNVPTCSDASQNLCRPDPNFGNISWLESSGDSWYNGAFVTLAKRHGNWLETRLSYTFSKSLDNAGNFFFSTPQDNFDLRDNKGLSDNDQRHRLTFSGGVSAPWRGHSAFGRIVKGMQLSWIYSYASALPFNIQLGADRNGDTNNNDRPIGVGRNTGRGFDFSSLDLRLSKKFGFGGSKPVAQPCRGRRCSRCSRARRRCRRTGRRSCARLRGRGTGGRRRCWP